MSRSPFEQVGEFHDAFARTPDPTTFVSSLSEDVLDLRRKLIHEETEELIEAVRMENRAAILQEFADLMYVVVGFARVLGITDTLAEKAFDEVHRANMSKLMPDGSVRRREDGKVLKGPNYQAPDLAGVLARYYGQS